MLRVAGIALLASWLAGCAGIGFIDITGLTGYADTSDRSAPRLPGRVYILRGIGHIWSGGMTELADELNRRGTTASAHRHGEGSELADEAVKLYKSDPEKWPIVLIGHSNGADVAISMAYRLKEKGVPVALIVGYDPTRFASNVPSNVQRYINLYQATNILGGGQIHPTGDFRGQLINVDLRNHFEIGHMNIDKSRRLQQEVIAKVLQVVAFPEPVSPAQMVSIKYVVPTKAPIELWDGGLPVTLEPGQTVQSLANLYGVPAWAIVQASNISDD
ncbi:MAG: thioesterase domain-containing protein, partial [Xanthobacteraceae bacterium]